MGALTQRRIDGKNLWKIYGRRRESFGRIETIALLVKTGAVTRVDAARYVLDHIPEDDLIEYRRSKGRDPLE